MTTLLPPTDLGGKIQRGLGSGYLEAVERPRAEIEPIVLGCIADDPRINAQDEQRDLYYARLILALRIDESAVGEILARDPDRDRSSSEDWLALGVMGLLARAGRAGAGAILADYVEWGAWWTEAVRSLSMAGDPAIDRLDSVVARRLSHDTDRMIGEFTWNEEPWRTWRDRAPLAALAPAQAPPDENAAVGLAALDTRSLLSQVRGHPRDPAAVELSERIRAGSVDERDALEQAISGSDRLAAARAVRILGLLGDPAIVPVGERILDEVAGGLADPGARLRRLVLHGFEGLPADDALRVARRWRDASDYRSLVAVRLLERHATADDLAWTVEAIRRAAAAGDDLYRYARILPRFPGAGPFDGFEAIYRSYVPTCCRGELLVGLSVADPTFADTLAPEVLNDCESRAREAAARTVAWSAATRDRLHAHAADPFEDDMVRSAANARLA